MLLKIYEMGTTKQCVFNLYFNYRENKEREWAEKTRDGVLTRGREWAEEKPDQALVYLKRLFENKAQFSCIPKDENQGSNCLLLRGYVNLNSQCTQVYAKRLLGKYSSCKPSYFGDMASLCWFVHVDRDFTVTGRLPQIGGNSIKKLKSFAGDPKFVVKVLLESIDKNDFEQHKEKTEETQRG